MAFLAGSPLGESKLLLVGTAATYAMVMLSLVLLTGYGGHVSLAQLTFAGVGALAYAKLDEPNLVGLLLSALVAAGVGALVALPVLRLTGLYLALVDAGLRRDHGQDGLPGRLRLRLQRHSGGRAALACSAHDRLDRRLRLVMALFFVADGPGLLALRRGVLGRMLIALRDSPAACGTLGLDARWFRVGLFGLSAGMAGLAGALYAGLRRRRGRGVPVLQQPAAAAARGGLRGDVGDRGRPRRGRADAAAGASSPRTPRRPG